MQPAHGRRRQRPCAGFIFGAADYAAMLAVNQPNVVLGAAETHFLKPSRVGDVLLAQRLALRLLSQQ